ncbi:hypothetical protein IQ07DRAFT_414869 [Pyrenochaeta sp. DS3sAY3a]|nr:hypothetical protein IQ07DRAFT_414869 [Pyrenochaeta sp. DS3sAY3a]
MAPTLNGGPLARPPPDDSASLCSDLVRFTPIPTLLLDARLVVRDVSDCYVTLAGSGDRDSLLGRHADDVRTVSAALPPWALARKVIRAAHDSTAVQQIKCVTDAGSAWNLRAIPILRNDRLRCIQMEFLNITAEHQKQLELEESLYANETFRILVETVKDYAIFMLDPTGHVATWNAGAQAFKGYTKADIVGKHFSQFYGEEDLANDKPGRELRDALRDGRVEDFGWRYRSDGSRFWANVVITPVYKGDVLLGFSKVTRDLTERRKAEQKLIAAYEEASKLKSEFLANMSHEIRTPMHGMLSALTLLLDSKLDKDQLELVDVIRESGDVLLQVINDILDYSKLASGSFSISQDIISVSDILQSVVRAHQTCHKAEVKLESFLDSNLPKSAEGDSLRYRQIVQNLLNNALKFTEAGYVHVVARLDDEDDDYFTILTKVVDTGIGIPTEGTSALFTPFTQFDNSATKRYKGTGLGLSICKNLAELMGGSIGFHANPEGRGSVFWFTAKLKKCHQKTMDISQGRISSTTTPSPAVTNPMEDIRKLAVSKRILLAEDNPINRKVMSKMLLGLGFRDIDVALDGKEAVNKALQQSEPFDVILMDVNMPVQDGVSATRELREKNLHCPIIAMTANALKGQEELYIAKGMTAYIAKPVDRNLLIKILISCLDQSSAG